MILEVLEIYKFHNLEVGTLLSFNRYCCNAGTVTVAAKTRQKRSVDISLHQCIS